MGRSCAGFSDAWHGAGDADRGGWEASEKRQGTKSRGTERVYGDLSDAAMVVAVRDCDLGDRAFGIGWGWGKIARAAWRSGDDLLGAFGRGSLSPACAVLWLIVDQRRSGARVSFGDIMRCDAGVVAVRVAGDVGVWRPARRSR